MYMRVCVCVYVCVCVLQGRSLEAVNVAAPVEAHTHTQPLESVHTRTRLNNEIKT